MPLTAEHAPQLARLGADAYPASFSLSSADIAETLSDVPEAENFSFGLFVDGEMFGYLLCWVDSSQVEELHNQPVLLLDDIVVTSPARVHLFALLRALRAAIVRRGRTQLAIEGTHRQEAEKLFNSHPRLVALLGYRQVATHHYFGEREREQLCWARYEPL